ncbi:MAG TPA: type II secretion system protein [Tepidisphaeraceae bacterium]|jgi:prepilin-type N-terminal cleavage/methylation domain-containing protein
MDRRASAGSRGFTLIETMTAIALLTIALGLMISLSRHVRAASADELTKEILHRLDAAMAVYVHQNGSIPSVPLFISEQLIPPETQLRRSAARNNEAFVRAMKSAGLLTGRFDDLSVAYYDEARVRDAWGSPIVFMSRMHPAIGMNPKGWFFFSAGPDRQYLTRDDNLYSYDQPVVQQ